MHAATRSWPYKTKQLMAVRTGHHITAMSVLCWAFCMR
jgi:hypothetical protein